MISKHVGCCMECSCVLLRCKYCLGIAAKWRHNAGMASSAVMTEPRFMKEEQEVDIMDVLNRRAGEQHPIHMALSTKQTFFGNCPRGSHSNRLTVIAHTAKNAYRPVAM